MAYNAWGTPGYASFAVESSPGIEQSPVNWIGPVIVFDPRLRNNIKWHKHAGSLQRVSWTPGVKPVDFSLRFRVNEGRIMYLAFGKEDVTGSDPWTHTLTVARPLPSATVELAIPDGANYFTQRYIGAKCAKLSLGVAVDGVLIADMDFAGLEVAKYTAKTSISDNNEKPYNFDQLTATLNSVELVNLRNFQWTLNNKVESLPHCGQREPNSWKEPSPDDDLTVELTMFDDTWWDAWNAGPPTEFDGDANFVRTATSDEFTIEWYDMVIDDPGMRLPEEGEIIQTLAVPPRYSKIVVIDGVSAYT